MPDPRLSPSAVRLVAAAAAAVVALGLVALGVQIGTNGLVGDGPGRNPGSSTVTPASASVDLARARGTSLEQVTASLVPAAGVGAFGSSSANFPSDTASGGTGVDLAAPPSTSTGTGGAIPPPPPPAPGPAPLLPSPVPAPAPAPSPAPALPPALDPIVDPILDVLEGLGATVPRSETPVAPVAPDDSSSLEGLVQQVLGV